MDEPTPITPETVATAEQLVGLSFTDDERQLMLGGLADFRATYEQVRGFDLPNDLAPALRFDPRLPGMRVSTASRTLEVPLPDTVTRPTNDEELAFLPVTHLASLIRTRQISSVELTELYLRRLKQYDPFIICVVTLTEAVALEQARRADAEIAAGQYRGPLHGIPYGAKDLLATAGIPTTWGDVPYQEQLFDYDAAVIERLNQAGAVLVAKLSLGGLAWGDVWFKGKTRNPWNLDEGSSGSSAGSAAAVAAGLVGFAIGSETDGSIISPATRCGVTGLRPTFGRVSRHGAMALSWSMDKLGPLCRSVEDCALVLNAIHGPDERDLTTVDLPFGWDGGSDITGLRIGYVPAAFEGEDEDRAQARQSLDTLRELGAQVVPIALPAGAIEGLSLIMEVEAAAAFDELLRSGAVNQLTRQGEQSWANVFRRARLISAVEYLQANRLRVLLMRQMAALFKTVDAYAMPPNYDSHLTLTNLTGHPAIALPNGMTERNTPTAITFVSQLYDEATLLRLAAAFQQATEYHLKRPLFEGRKTKDEGRK